MRLILLGAVGAVALAGCAPMASAPMPEPAPIQCDAPANQSLIGQNIAAVSFPAGANVRIACTTCPTTREYIATRLDIRFDQATGLITSAACG